MRIRLIGIVIIVFGFICSVFAQDIEHSTIKGDVFSGKNPLCYATVYVKNTKITTNTDEEGHFLLSVPKGNITVCVSYLGKEVYQTNINEIRPKETRQLHIVLKEKILNLKEVIVSAKSPTKKINESAYNVTALETKSLQNSTKNLSDALAQIPGMKLRESGGVGSNLQLMMDGFSGKNIRIFIDGVPQEGVGSSFGLNNIPINYAERIEVYRGVVPVSFGTDALGGVINIVTKKHLNNWFVDASYSFGSFNTHKSFINFGQTFKNGFIYEVNTFQNYSDNDYYVDTPVKDFSTGAIDNSNLEHEKRFHDTYHNEAIIGKLGFVNKKWADRFIIGLTYSNMHKDIQTGVRQEVVFGSKYHKGHSILPSLEYRKYDMLIKGLDLSLMTNYNRDIIQNVDTSNYEFNWKGEKRRQSLPGEQTYQNIRSTNSNWNGTITANYKIGTAHQFTLNYVYNNFRRVNESLLNATSTEDAIAKETRKNFGGISYLFRPNEKLNLSVFGKYYNQFIAGPVATSAAQDQYSRMTNSIHALGYGVAGTYFILPELQTKFSYEKAYRLPTNEEIFGDEDLENGDVKLKPEYSNNLNLSLDYSLKFNHHSLSIGGGIIYRNVNDYIQRKIVNLSGGKVGAAYENHGRVKIRGYNIDIHYEFTNWLSISENLTQTNVYDNVKTISGESNQQSLTYGARMPNIPYRFANSDINLYWHGLGAKDNSLIVTYDNLYVHNFPLYSEALGRESKFIVPSQFSHNLTFTYTMKKGRYNFSLECRNFTNEKLYDNFSLQKAGRAFYGKIRVNFGN